MRTWVLILGLISAACGSSAPTAPSAPPAPVCQTNQTADLTLANASPNNYTFDVLIDNVRRGTVSPGQSLGPVSVTAGINHTVESRLTNTTVVACTSTTSFAVCTTPTLTCRY